MTSSTPPLAVRDPATAMQRFVGLGLLATCGVAALMAMPTRAATALADQPLFSTASVPGNLGLVLSVEYPTAVSVAHTNRSYDNTSEYLGLFDPGKCYDYRYVDGTGTDNYFYLNAVAAANHICNGKWSGNFLNWATMQTIDPFRWVLTGGYRVVDEAARTVIEKAWATGQGGTGNFPDAVLATNMMAGATPYSAASGPLYMRIQGLGNKMRFALPDPSNVASFSAKFYNTNNRSGGAVLTRTDTTIDFDWGNGSPGTGVNADYFSAAWTGNLTAPTAGSYLFRLKADDRAQLWVNGVQLINQTSYVGMAYQTSAAIVATAGQTLGLTVIQEEDAGGAGIQLQWKRPGDPDFITVGDTLSSLYDSATHLGSTASVVPGGVYEVFGRAKVCDSAAPGGVEANCTAYGSNYKPEGLIQRYANKIRYSAFGYLNDSNIKRDGGVLRARQKFVGPTQPVPGSSAVTNLLKEWDPSTGIFVRNPDTADATATSSAVGSTIADSGVINYLNKFGEITPGSYKTYDNVSELYYAAIRYLKNQGNVPDWTDMSGATNATKATWADGFPVITDWKLTKDAATGRDVGDPILYSCQRNFVLGIGDANTHADKNVPGNTQTQNEPTMPALVTADTTVNAVTATNKVGSLEPSPFTNSSLGTDRNINGCCNDNSSLMAGLAYDSHTKDIRPSDAGHLSTDRSTWQTIDTYWVDVLEYTRFKNNNQFYLAAKYGGFDVPDGYNPYTNTTALSESWWHTPNGTTDTNTLTDSTTGVTQKRPDNYYTGSQPDLVKSGLEAAFKDIASKAGAFTTSFSTSLPQVMLTGNKSYSSLYNAESWTGEIAASTLVFDASTGAPTFAKVWSFASKLAAQAAGTGWNTGRRIVTSDGTSNANSGVQFRSALGTGITAIPTGTQLGYLNTSYVSGNDNVNYLNYLRGDKSNEQVVTNGATSGVYRTRTSLLGDIVGSKARPVGAPAYPFADATNPGYSAFKTTWKNRQTVVYVASNNGLMHAINGSVDTSDSTAGTELFAYVPAALFKGPNSTPNTDGLASLGDPAYSHHYMVNASPNVYDIDFGRVPNASGVAQTGTADWRSVLIGGLGKGGRSYYAIDVTNPFCNTGGNGTSTCTETAIAGKVLWEFTDTDLGSTFGDPIVVKTVKYGWVVILPSGYNNADGKGYFFIVNPKTGALLEKRSTGAGSTGSSAGLAHANAFVIDATDGTADAVYAGDLLGNLWRWDLTATSGTYPAPLKLATLADASGSAQPVMSRPMIEVHPRLKKRFVLVGTGQLLDNTDIVSTAPQSFYAISDGSNARFNIATDLPVATTPAISFPFTRAMLGANTGPAALPFAAAFNPSTQMGWYEDLGVPSGTNAYRVTSEASTLTGSVAWSGILTNGSACSPSGVSRIYCRDYSNGQSTCTVPGTVTSTDPTPDPAVVPYVDAGGNITDLRNLSVDGKGRLIACTDNGNCKQVDTKSSGGMSIRRMNWRELQVVD